MAKSRTRSEAEKYAALKKLHPYIWQPEPPATFTVKWRNESGRYFKDTMPTREAALRLGSIASTLISIKKGTERARLKLRRKKRSVK